MEVWKDVTDYEGLYQVSNLGNVKVSDREVYQPRWDKYYTRKGKILTVDVDKDGYYRVSLRKDKKNKKFFIHRLIALIFIQNPDNKPVVDHINNIKNDNRVENLRWCSVQENTKWAHDDGLIDIKKGEQIHSAKLTENSVLEIKLLLQEQTMSQHDIAKKFEVSRSRISEIKNGKSWKHIE